MSTDGPIADRDVPKSTISLLSGASQRVKGQMGAGINHLRLVEAPGSPAASGCRSHGCQLVGDDDRGLCPACHAVYATAEVLYQRLVAREMARMELRTPGIGRAALAALHAKLARLDPPVAPPSSSHASATEGWMPEEWELNRLDAFLAELRTGLTPREGA